MASLPRKRNEIRYTMAQLVELRRQMLRFARLLPRGPERNDRRRTAASLRDLFKNKTWLEAHTVEGSVTEYRIYRLDAGGNSLKTIKLDRADDHAAVESAKQYIDGRDVELWQGDRRIEKFKHTHE
jgi:hypothetical protein